MRIPNLQTSYLRYGLMIACSLLPIFIVLILPVIAQWQDAVPLLAGPGHEESVAPEILAELSSDMTSIAIAVIIGAAVLLREWRDRYASKQLWIVTTAAVSFAAASCYAGVRFRFAIAEQILITPLDLDVIGDRLAAQGALLLAAFSGLIYMALLSFLRPAPAPSSPPPKQTRKRRG